MWGPVVQWLVRRFRSERLRVRSRRSATFTPSAHVRRQSLPVWPPTLNNYLYLYLYIDRARGPAPRGKIKSVRTHSEVIEQFDSFSLLKLLFLVRNWHCWSRKAFPRQMTPQSREKKLRNGGFSTPLTGMKSHTVDHGCTPAPKDATNLSVFFRFFGVFNVPLTSQ